MTYTHAWGGEEHTKCNSFQYTSDLHNSDNLKVAIAQISNELHSAILLCYS